MKNGEIKVSKLSVCKTEHAKRYIEVSNLIANNTNNVVRVFCISSAFIIEVDDVQLKQKFFTFLAVVEYLENFYQKAENEMKLQNSNLKLNSNIDLDSAFMISEIDEDEINKFIEQVENESNLDCKCKKCMSKVDLENLELDSVIDELENLVTKIFEKNDEKLKDTAKKLNYQLNVKESIPPQGYKSKPDNPKINLDGTEFIIHEPNPITIEDRITALEQKMDCIYFTINKLIR